MYFKILRRIFAVLQGKLPDPYLLALKRITATVLIRNRYAQEALESFSADRVKDAVSSEFKFQKSYDHDVSIILPVYNMEKFIGRALDSLLEIKTKYDLEILVVNDGSTDSSEAIILEKLHDAEVEDGVTFRLINQTNKGFSGARNRGIEEARGRYLFFMDVDDKIDSSTVDDLLSAAFEDDLDIVQGTAIGFSGDKEWPIVFDSLSGYPWGKMFKRSLFRNVRFPENAWFEDSIMAYLIYPKVRTYRLVEGGNYYYFKNREGITATAKTNPKSIDTFYVMKSMYSMQAKLDVPQTRQRFLEYERQIKLNSIRVEQLSWKVRYALFQETRIFLEAYLEDNPLMADVRKTGAVEALLRKDFRSYILETLLS
ncbi:glycosyltransferase family A protein [Weissella confusa]|uniref:glycosyltransferase family 2 protein n=1 Tax=Weissella confusa TaxID=1583 RepID=UPI0016813839|nr:glycosyltransferase family A protein [Weissella confusa]MBD1491004.1 glycosyltransferase family 2 protein [Weissella confusa]MBJ7662920.1 glycosyltransferase family 2 protein [Weissella confusa]